MTQVWAQTAMWLGLALIATLLSIWLKVATALSEIVVGTIAQLVIGVAAGAVLLAADDSAIKFLSGAGAIVLTFLAGTELDPQVFRRKWKEASAIGLAGFLFPSWAARRQRTGCWAGSRSQVGSLASPCRPYRSPWSTPSCWNSA
jgi:glutathione-regulated potassium-efflux system ancillary protein KefC